MYICIMYMKVNFVSTRQNTSKAESADKTLDHIYITCTCTCTCTHMYMYMYTLTAVHCTCMYIVVAVPKQDSMSPARANAAPVWALQLICWTSTMYVINHWKVYVVIQTAYKPLYAAPLLSDIQQIHVHERSL